MKRAILAGLLLAAAPLAGLAAQNWNATYAETERGHQLGNPEATTQLIAFVSYSCPHCKNFEVQSEGPLQLTYVQPGKVSLEVRHVIRNPLDLAAALAAECGPESKFWGNHRAIVHAQDRWLPIAANATQAQAQRWSSGSLGARMRAIAADLDFYELLEPRGYSAVALDRCLMDEAAARAIVSHAQADDQAFNISGTPSFAINGTLVDGVHNWSGLKPAIDRALR